MAQYRNVLVVDSQWQVMSAVRDVLPDSSHDFERLESRLRVQRAALRHCLANKPSTRHQLDMLRLVAVLSTLFVAMKRRMKVPNIARTLHNMPGLYSALHAYQSVDSFQRKHVAVMTQCEMTSQNLWSRYDRHFVGITWHNVWS